jgi:shikimate dehydrogenase
MKKFVLIGNPVNHSLSPVMYRRAFAECGIDAQYSTERVETGDVKNKLKEFISYGFSGVNVTMPHKIEALYAVDVVDSLAETLGAVNTIVIKNGQSIGYNTDGLGFLNSIKSVFTENVEDMHVLIFGAGGMGRSAALQLAIHGCRKITLVNRSFSKSEILRNDILNLNNSLEVNITSYDILEEVNLFYRVILFLTPYIPLRMIHNLYRMRNLKELNSVMVENCWHNKEPLHLNIGLMYPLLSRL